MCGVGCDMCLGVLTHVGGRSRVWHTGLIYTLNTPNPVYVFVCAWGPQVRVANSLSCCFLQKTNTWQPRFGCVDTCVARGFLVSTLNPVYGLCAWSA